MRYIPEVPDLVVKVRVTDRINRCGGVYVIGVVPEGELKGKHVIINYSTYIGDLPEPGEEVTVSLTSGEKGRILGCVGYYAVPHP